MGYHVTCECGQSVLVTADQAGSEVVCGCGTLVRMARLSELRNAAGEGAYESGILDTIRRMEREGKLPVGNVCQLSGRQTSDVARVLVECEHKWVRGRNGTTSGLFLLGMLTFPLWWFWAILFADEREKEAREDGNEITIDVPVRIDRDSISEFDRLSQRRLRRLLRATPVYRQLWDEYPRARVLVVKSGVAET